MPTQEQINDAAMECYRAYIMTTNMSVTDMFNLFLSVIVKMETPTARLLTWCGPAHFPVPFDGTIARTFSEFPEINKFHDYWKEGEPLFTIPQPERPIDEELIIEQARKRIRLLMAP